MSITAESSSLVWEGLWDSESKRFCLWAESEERLRQVTSGAAPSNGGVEAIASPEIWQSGETPLHPFAAPFELLEAPLREAEVQAFEQKTLELILPTEGVMPCCSPKFHRENNLAPSGCESARWLVPALALPPLEAILLLSSPSEPGQLRLRFDESVIFFREATKLCLDLLTRGRLVPALEWDAGSYRSSWVPVLTEPVDSTRLSFLADSMPAICRSGAIRRPDARAILDDFLGATADPLVRLFLRRAELSPQISKPRHIAASEWLQSLTRDESRVNGPEHELSGLDERLRRWSSRLLPIGKTQQLQTVFRVLPPELGPDDDEETAQWTIEFLLRQKNNPDKCLTAEELWSGQLGFLRHSEHLTEEIEDTFLSDLGRAVKIFPELSRALTDTYPTHLQASTEEVYSFLRDRSRGLEELGFGLLLPSWWNKPSSKLGLKLTLDSAPLEGAAHARSPFLASQQLLDFTWNVAFGDRELTRQEFQELIARKTPLVRISGQWAELDPEQLAATLKFMEEQEQRGKLSFVEALHLGLGLEDRAQTFPIVGFSARGWLEQFLDSEQGKIELLKEPEGFLGELRPYQLEGLSWLSFRMRLGIGACLADDMGLGKTVQFLALLLHERDRRELIGGVEARRPTLLVVPMSILANWEQEIRRFAPSISVYLHHGAQRLTRDHFIQKAQSTDLVITTYSLAFRDEEFLSAVSWAGIVLDEAQNIKNTETKQTKAIRRLCHTQMKRAGSGAPFQRMALTGTPLENHLEELWSIFDFLNPGFLGTLGEFRTRFALPIERFRNKAAASALSRLLKPFVLRRLKVDPKIIDDLPEKIEMQELVPLTREQAGLYQKALDDMLPQVEAASGMHRKGLVLATITKLKQICDHPVLYLKDGSEIGGRSHKISRLEALLEEIVAEGDKVLLFTQFTQLGHLLQPYLQQRFDTEVLFLHGALPKQAREKLVNRFQTPTGPPIFILSLKAGGFGLNLTEANQVVHLDQWWNPAVEDQATDRAYRIGQKRNVQVRKLICQGTLEERIAEMLKHKKELADQIVGSTKDSITQLSTEELRRLLELSAAPGFSENLTGEDEELS